MSILEFFKKLAGQNQASQTKVSSPIPGSAKVSSPIPGSAKVSFFDTAVNRLLAHEGGYVNHKNDPGKATNWGISQRSYPDIDIRRLTRAAAIEIYRRDFWNEIHGDELPKSLSFQLFDFAVNSDIPTAILLLQRAVGVPESGKLDTLTLSAINNYSDSDVTQLLIANRLEYYTKLSLWGTFGRGWARRMVKNIRYNVTDT